MSEGTNRTANQIETLRAAYEEAFRNWSAEVNRMRSAGGDLSSGDTATREMRRKVAETRQAYHEARESLAARLLDTRSEQKRPDVERLAYQLWEQSGRHHGDQESHWFRAEQLLNRRHAAV